MNRSPDLRGCDVTGVVHIPAAQVLQPTHVDSGPSDIETAQSTLALGRGKLLDSSPVPCHRNKVAERVFYNRNHNKNHNENRYKINNPVLELLLWFQVY